MRITDREDDLGPYSVKEDLGRRLIKHTDRTRNQYVLLVIGILPSSSKYDLVIMFLESAKAFFLSSSFLTFALVHRILKIDIWLPVFFFRIVLTVIYISNCVPKIQSHLHMSQSLFLAFKNSLPNFVNYFVS